MSIGLESPYLIEQQIWDAARLETTFPPRLEHPHKRGVYEGIRATPAAGSVTYTRWRPRPLPDSLPTTVPLVEAVPSPFAYETSGPGIWHVNFADPRLFVSYGSGLLAQDELQVLEHPILGSVREALLASGRPAITEDDEQPTPVLLTGIERRCSFDTSNLYGNRFSRAPFDEVRRAVTILRPSTTTQLIAMAAPVGSGTYRIDQLFRVVVTAHSAFSAARELSGCPVEIHTGFWGCGAFGGNRTVMTGLQLLAARLAGVERIVFHTVTQSGISDFSDGTDALAAVLAKGAPTTAAVLDRFAARRDEWGVSDGN